MITDKNFSIVMSGGCNAKCDFCTDSQTRKASRNYIVNLVKVLSSLSDEYQSCSITGGEPTLSRDLYTVLGLVKARGFERVVLTTNGSGILEAAEELKGLVNHVNISRHMAGGESNYAIFGTDKIGSDSDIIEAIKILSKGGIDTTINCVYSKDCEPDPLINYAKSLGASAVCFRHDHSNKSLKKTKLEERFSEWEPVHVSSCPVCRTHSIIYNGMPVIFKASLHEPSKSLGEPYELIYHINGKLTTDWAGENVYRDHSVPVTRRRVRSQPAPERHERVEVTAEEIFALEEDDAPDRTERIIPAASSCGGGRRGC